MEAKTSERIAGDAGAAWMESYKGNTVVFMSLLHCEARGILRETPCKIFENVCVCVIVMSFLPMWLPLTFFFLNCLLLYYT